MKKQSLLLITGGILAFASCNSDTAGNADNSQAKIDSMVNERVEEIRMELQMKNDSIINELAIYRADSIMAAAKGKTVTRTKPKAAPAPVYKEATMKAEEPAKNSKQDRFDGTESNTDKKAARFDEEAAAKEKEKNANKKADRFK